jgi:hypothetical protein
LAGRSLRPGSRPRRRRDHGAIGDRAKPIPADSAIIPPGFPSPTGREPHPGVPPAVSRSREFKKRASTRWSAGPTGTRTGPFSPGSGAPRIAPAETAEKSSVLEIFYSSPESAFSPQKDAVHARNYPRRGPRAPKTGKGPLQCPRNGSFRGLSTPAIAPTETLELPANLFSAGSCSLSEDQRLLEARMKGLLPSLIVASEPLNHLP